ncbi:hypothetical protein [Microbacterium panaciterrae]|uniref:Uncharacterized protein n=1 Tax=Microbacterium panaciterrae TaxID=985759 RepID=A0ABP8PC59_9MICO
MDILGMDRAMFVNLVAALLIGVLLGVMLTIVVYALWRDKRARLEREAVAAESFRQGWNGGVDKAWDAAARFGAEHADRRWREWYARNFPEESDGVAGSA